MSEELIQEAVGLHKNRLKENANNPREVVFVKHWREQNQCSNTLKHLFTVPCKKEDDGAWARNFIGPEDYIRMPLGEVTERDRIVAETVIQWLGSNVGHSFIREVLSECGYEVRKESNGNQPK